MTDRPRVEVIEAINEIRRWANDATPAALRAAAKLVARTYRAIAPRSKSHRVRRSYGGGRIFEDAKSISRAVTYRVGRQRRSKESWFALVRSAVGYSVFQNWGWVARGRNPKRGGAGRRISGKHFAEEALAQNEGEVVRFLQGDFVKADLISRAANWVIGGR